MYMKTAPNLVLLAAAAGALGLISASARASLTTTPVTTAGTYSYNYSPYDGVSVNGGPASGTSTTIPTAANASSADLYVQVGFIAGGTYGVSNATTNSDTMTWDFQTAPGLAFGSGFTFSAGGLNNDTNSTMTAAYSTNNGATYTTFFNNNNKSQGLDSTQFVSGVNLTGTTQLLVQFTLQDSAANQAAFFWGSTDPMGRAFILSGNVVATPEPATLAPFAAGAVGLLLMARHRKLAR